MKTLCANNARVESHRAGPRSPQALAAASSNFRTIAAKLITDTAGEAVGRDTYHRLALYSFI